MAGSKRYADFVVERNFLGYGFKTPDPHWPGEAKIAINFLVHYTEGAETSMEHGDPHSENLFVEPICLKNMDRRNDMVESEFEFGPRVGLPRLLRELAKYKMPCTVNMVVAAIKRAPYWVKKIQEAGHEISCGSYRWIDYRHVEPEVEESHILAAIEDLQALTGDKDGPQGWYIGRRSNLSPRLYARASKAKGIKLLYSSDSYGDDLPFWVASPLADEGEQDDGMLVIPHSMSTNDFRFNMNGSGWSTGEDFYQQLVDAFDVLHEEGCDGEPKLLSIGLHPHIIGRAGRMGYFVKFLEYISKKEGVWVARRDEIAKHWMQQFPYNSETSHGKLE